MSYSVLFRSDVGFVRKLLPSSGYIAEYPLIRDTSNRMEPSPRMLALAQIPDETRATSETRQALLRTLRYDLTILSSVSNLELIALPPLPVLPGMDARLVDLAVNQAITLLEPKKRIDITDLQLPWRPIYAILEKELFPKQRKTGIT